MSSKRVPGCGPVPSPISLVGEAPGENEDLYGRPFVGPAGEELTRMLSEAGLDRSLIYATNVFKYRPPDNKVDLYFASRASGLDIDTSRPGRKGKYLLAEYRDEVNGLVPELVSVGTRIAVALGGTALWALLGYDKISDYTGTLHPPTPERPFWVIPTYHPSAVLRQWSLRTTTIKNLLKAADHWTELQASGEAAPQAAVARPPSVAFNPRLILNPSLAVLTRFMDKAVNYPLVACDVETFRDQITTISFAYSENDAICCPFWEPPGRSYWPTARGECLAWEQCGRVLSEPRITKLGHNFSYDIQRILRGHGVPIRGPFHDSMLAHHALEPELPKRLGDLAAAYLNIPEWKTMRHKALEKEED